MPCAVTKAEEEFFEKHINEKKFGVPDLTKHITTCVACELSKLVEVNGLSDQLSTLAKKWCELHRKEDEERDEPV